MSDSLTADEKRRLLRERRQAKMNAKATDRLNTILTSGSSVNETASSPLNKKPTATEVPVHSDAVRTVSVPAVSLRDEDDDPEDIDISAHGTPQPPSFAGGAPPATEDFDAMLNKIFGAGPGAGAQGAGAADGDADPFAMMMQMLNSGDPSGGAGGFPGMPSGAEGVPESLYQAKLQKYYAYQQKKTKTVFFIVRFITTVVNFFYHYHNSPENAFQASSQAAIRKFEFSKSGFFSWFITIEVGILATYFFVVSNTKYIANDGNLILKGISMASMFLPQVQLYRPLILRLLSYWEVLGMFIGDVALITLLFGLTSYFG